MKIFVLSWVIDQWHFQLFAYVQIFLKYFAQAMLLAKPYIGYYPNESAPPNRGMFHILYIFLCYKFHHIPQKKERVDLSLALG